MILNIKNMVCNRCIKVVREELQKMGYTIEDIKLGEVVTKEDADENELKKISNMLLENGFELLEDQKKKIAEEIKTTIINTNHYSDNVGDKNFSELIENAVGKDYAYLSKLFSSIENITIEHYIILQKIEKVKELLKYNEMTLSEIAYKLGYKSVNHLSNQFKKLTGLTATEFKNLNENTRKPLDLLK